MSCKCGWQGDERVPRSAQAGLIGAMVGGPFLMTLIFGIAGLAGAEERIAGAMAAAGGGPGSVLGFAWGYCFARFGRLKPRRGKRCVTGLVVRIARNPHPPPFAALTYDPDWSFDLIPKGSNRANPSPLICKDADYVRCFPPPLSECRDQGQDVEHGQPSIHCEIPSSIQEAGCIGGMTGAGLGAAAGLAFLASSTPSCVGWGPFAPLCLLLALIVAAFITLLGAEIGAEIGHAAGAASDEKDGLHKIWTTAMCGSCMTVEGEWVTDTDHRWNEIHDVTSVEYLVKARDDKPLLSADACPDKCPGADFTLRIVPPARAVAPGGTATFEIGVKDLNPGTSEPVTLALASGLPSSAKAAFSPPSPVVPDAKVTLTITTTAATPKDDYVFMVRGTAASGTRTATAKLLVMDPLA